MVYAPPDQGMNTRLRAALAASPSQSAPLLVGVETGVAPIGSSLAYA